MMRREVIGDATLYLGDCREVLGEFPPVDCVITDPPYGINTKSDGNGKLSPWADLCNSSLWYADWLQSCRGLIGSRGCLWTFMNWRSMVTFQKASCDIRWPIESLLVWDKDWIGPGGSKGLRPSYEMAALFAADGFALPDRSLRDIQRFPWSSQKPNGHPAEKPEDLMQWLVKISTGHGDLVADLFMGSGTTGAACARMGRRFVGVEIDEKWFDIACRRIEAAQKQTALFVEPAMTARPTQDALL